MIEGAVYGAIGGFTIGAIIMGLAGIIKVSNVKKAGYDTIMRLAKERDYKGLAKVSTHNPYARGVMLGKYDGGGVTSYIAKAGKSYTYFSLNFWNDIADVIGNKNMWKVNQAFLHQQICLGKTFYASHPISSPTGSFLREINYLKELNINVLV